jgi:putative DNA primase/helicase
MLADPPAKAEEGRRMSPRLLPHHLDDLRKSGLTDETIAKADVYSEVDYRKISTLLNWRRPQKTLAPALVFPFYDENGRNGFYRIKPDRPRVRDKKPFKYESPFGGGNKPYYPPDVIEVLHDPGQYLLITEGEKKSLAASQAGFPCIGITGVHNWKPKHKETLIPELERLPWKGRYVYIAFDSDIAEKPDVQEAESRLAAILKSRGANVKVIRFPSGVAGPDGKSAKMGIDDYLVAFGPDALRRLISEAQEPDEPASAVLKPKAAELDPAEIAEEALETTKVDDMPRLRFYRGSFWRWSCGAYRDIPTSEVRADIIKYLNDRCTNLNTSVTNNVMDQVKAQSCLRSKNEPPCWIAEPKGEQWPPDEVLITKRELIHLPSLVAKKDDYRMSATPRFFTTSALDFDFDAEAPIPSTWLEFLQKLWPEDPESIETLQMWFGLCLTNDTRLQKMLVLCGAKRSGKGTIARILRALVGFENCAGPTLASLGTNFGLWALVGKTLAIVSDARLSGRTDSAIVVERLLSISGEDALTIDRKNLEPITCKLPTRIMIISNELPRLSDSSGALVSRMILLRLTETWYGREDHGLTDKLLSELPGILRWSIDGWAKLRETGRLVQPHSAEGMLDELSDMASPISAFVRECCGVGLEYRAAVDDLFGEWKSWCEANGRREPGTIQIFARDLLAAVPSIRRVQCRDGGLRYRAYDGIGLVLRR